MLRCSVFIVSLFLSPGLFAQPGAGYWQQRVKYTMNIDMNVQNNRFAGKQKVEYWNNSSGTLKRVFFHLYWNAFQPNSMMDINSRLHGSIVFRDEKGNDATDWDTRVKDRIKDLDTNEIGYDSVLSLTMDGRSQQYIIYETILEVRLDKPIAPHTKVTFDMTWKAQVPLQVRRSGRDNPYTGVRYTMTQWYPKLCEYDKDGWHPTPYIGREFYGVWGDFDVTITIDKKYMLAGTGDQDSTGDANKPVKTASPGASTKTWHFVAHNVHDFAWAADPDYKPLIRPLSNGRVIHVWYNANPTKASFDAMSDLERAVYKNSFAAYVKSWDKQWEELADAVAAVFPFVEDTFGKYPYQQFSFIQGGDGLMEYPMCTMLAGPGLNRAFHQLMHSWYYGVLATNESLYAWMDEGFAEWAGARVEKYYEMRKIRKTASNKQSGLKNRPGSLAAGPLSTYKNIYEGYFDLVSSDREEPLTTHADHYNTNYAYMGSVYNKGGIFLEQLEYIVGAKIRDNILLEYYNLWQFKHPDADDFIRVAEKVSGLKLDWYKEYWINTTKTIDYAIDNIWISGDSLKIRLRNIGLVPMPLEIKLTFKDRTREEWLYIPLDLMFGTKPAGEGQQRRIIHQAWKWTHSTYETGIKWNSKDDIDSVEVEIDPSQRMADIDRANNKARFINR